MPAGTPLYSPVNGKVTVAGGTSAYTFYGNGQPGVGHLQIETDDGNIVILGHMGRIVVDVGQRVSVGEFVGLSGGDNGDHLHLETRELQPGGYYLIVDPRKSFLIDALAGFSPFHMTGGQVVVEAETAQQVIARGDDSWTLSNDIPKFDGAGFAIAGPDNGDSASTDYATTSPQLRFTINVDTPGTYTLWLRVYSHSGGSDSIYYGLDGVGLTDSSGQNGIRPGAWRWVKGSVPVVISSSGRHVIDVWMREDGLRFDRFVLTSDPDFTPTKKGPSATDPEAPTTAMPTTPPAEVRE
jgi:hypothetical protein